MKRRSFWAVCAALAIPWRWFASKDRPPVTDPGPPKQYLTPAKEELAVKRDLFQTYTELLFKRRHYASESSGLPPYGGAFHQKRLKKTEGRYVWGGYRGLTSLVKDIHKVVDDLVRVLVREFREGRYVLPVMPRRYEDRDNPHVILEDRGDGLLLGIVLDYWTLEQTDPLPFAEKA
jgi:hypothetical protein